MKIYEGHSWIWSWIPTEVVKLLESLGRVPLRTEWKTKED